MCATAALRRGLRLDRWSRFIVAEPEDRQTAPVEDDEATQTASDGAELLLPNRRRRLK